MLLVLLPVFWPISPGQHNGPYGLGSPANINALSKTVRDTLLSNGLIPPP